MYAVTVGGGPQFEHNAPALLFARPEMSVQQYYRSYDVSPDGKRFIMLMSGGVASRSLNVIFNWGQGRKGKGTPK